MYNFFKNFLIASLIILAVYQTNELWFEDFSSHNFFYSFLHSGINTQNASETSSEAEYGVVNNGTGRFILTYDKDSVNTMAKALSRAGAAAVKGEEPEIYERCNLQDIIKNRCIVVHYGFLMSGADFSSLYEVGSYDSMPDFDSIAVSDDSSEVFTVLFFNSETLEGAVYEMKDYSGLREIETIIDEARLPYNEIYYVSSLQNSYDVFLGNEFIPTWAGEVYYYTITKNNPAAENGIVTETSVDKFVNVYFDNPVLKWTSVDDGVYIFSDESTVIKYYPAGVMEYSSYTGEQAETLSLKEGLSTAESFLDYDTNLNNDYYLADYKYETGSRITFYFDCKINNAPLTLSEELKENTGMNSFIEVTVEGSNVTKYKRYLRDYVTTVKDPVYTEKTFLEVIDNGLSILGGEYIESLKLSYLESGEDSVPICYVVSIDGKNYVETAF
ncbi:MAG: hypothetical protein LUC97_06625 [Clostridiales bacterium]|nr:hypothetical protein [Clostridiales bacterium]